MNRELFELHRLHKEALEQYDFMRAEQINNQIHEKMNELRPPLYNKVEKIERDKKNLRNKSKMVSNELIESVTIIKNAYEEQALRLKEKQKEELLALRRERKQALEREKRRVIPEAEYKRRKAFQIGRARNYKEAQQLYDEANAMAAYVIPIRLRECRKAYDYLKYKMKVRHQKEQERLLTKYINDTNSQGKKAVSRQQQLATSLKYMNMKQQQEVKNAENPMYRRKLY